MKIYRLYIPTQWGKIEAVSPQSAGGSTQINLQREEKGCVEDGEMSRELLSEAGVILTDTAAAAGKDPMRIQEGIASGSLLSPSHSQFFKSYLRREHHA